MHQRLFLTVLSVSISYWKWSTNLGLYSWNEKPGLVSRMNQATW